MLEEPPIEHGALWLAFVNTLLWPNYTRCATLFRYSKQELAIEELTRDVGDSSEWVHLGREFLDVDPLNFIPLTISVSNDR